MVRRLIPSTYNCYALIHFGGQIQSSSPKFLRQIFDLVFVQCDIFSRSRKIRKSAERGGTRPSNSLKHPGLVLVDTVTRLYEYALVHLGAHSFLHFLNTKTLKAYKWLQYEKRDWITHDHMMKAG